MFKGAITALVTPFTAQGALDENAFADLVEWQISEGIHGLVPVGTTGESPTLSHDEHHRVVAMCIEVAAGRVPVIAGAGSNSTSEAVSLACHAADAGADAVLVVTPYYNKPTQEGLYQHYKAVAESADIPVLIYNIPGRSVIDMSVDTMARLAEMPNIVGVKDATVDLTRPVATRRVIGPDFCQLSGEDGTVVGFLAQGGAGCISVVSNVAPSLCAQMHEAWQASDLAKVAEIRDLLDPLARDLFCEANPGPVKYALSLLGRGRADVRLPLVELTPESQSKVEAALRHAGLLG